MARTEPEPSASPETLPEAAHDVEASREGEVLGKKYELLRKLGEGGMGEVYEARHLVLGRRFAVKLLHPELTRSHRMMNRFSRETLEASLLESDHIVSVVDCGHTDVGTPYYVMELLRGEDLRQVLRREAKLAVPRAVKLIVDLCRGLRVAHERGLVHRDLKPENVFVARRDDGREVAKILDFGVVLVAGSDSTTQAGTLVGTIRYMSPEQVRGKERVDARADIYSLGVVLYECLAGESPYAGRNAEELLFHIMNETPRPLLQLRPEVPAGLEKVISRALARDASERHPTAVDLAEALIPYAGERLPSLRDRYELHAPEPSSTGSERSTFDTEDEEPPPAQLDSSRRSVNRTRFGWAVAAIVGCALGFQISGSAESAGCTGRRGAIAKAYEPPVLTETYSIPAVAPLDAKTFQPNATPSAEPGPNAMRSADTIAAPLPTPGSKKSPARRQLNAWFDPKNPYATDPQRAP